jgi:LmbE family N-acetylglucosaminyl deacetylase
MYAPRILVLVPHPDDEVVGCCAAIGRARAQGARVFALYLSNGVPDRALFWPWQRAGHETQVATRWREAEAAQALLGLEQAGRQDVPTRVLRLRMAETLALIIRALDATGATMLWAPAYEGGHQDHDVTNALARRLRASAIGGRVAVWEFSEYHNAGGRVHAQAFIASNGSETVLTLDGDEVARKRAALALYASEQANLGYIGSAREAFRPLATYDYAQAPHPGVLFHARFRYVWGHPRVDRTPPAAVRRAITAFMAQTP